jgi:hypothetical protein
LKVIKKSHVDGRKGIADGRELRGGLREIVPGEGGAVVYHCLCAGGSRSGRFTE